LKLLFSNGDQDVGRDCAPDLRLHGVLSVAQELLDSQMLLDPFKERLDVPSAFVKCCDSEWRQDRVVGQEDQCLVGLGVFESNPAQVFGIVLGGIEAIHGDGLIADHTAELVGWSGIDSPRIHVGLGPGHEEGPGLVHREESSKIQVAAIHDLKGSSLDGQDIQHVDFVHLAVADTSASAGG
jgi:hypothetical protein